MYIRYSIRFETTQESSVAGVLLGSYSHFKFKQHIRMVAAESWFNDRQENEALDERNRSLRYEPEILADTRQQQHEALVLANSDLRYAPNMFDFNRPTPVSKKKYTEVISQLNNLVSSPHLQSMTAKGFLILSDDNSNVLIDVQISSMEQLKEIVNQINLINSRQPAPQPTHAATGPAPSSTAPVRPVVFAGSATRIALSQTTLDFLVNNGFSPDPSNLDKATSSRNKLYTPLTLAAVRLDVASCQSLLADGASVNARNGVGNTAAHMLTFAAINSDHDFDKVIQLAKIFIQDYSSDLNIKNNENKSPLDTAKRVLRDAFNELAQPRQSAPRSRAQ